MKRNKTWKIKYTSCKQILVFRRIQSTTKEEQIARKRARDFLSTERQKLLVFLGNNSTER